MKKYLLNIKNTFDSFLSGISLTIKHLVNARLSHLPTNVESENYFLQKDGIITLSYPFESLSIPDNGRYRLNNEIEDCIVCDKCAVVCPVDCIAIETIKSPEPIGETSDGSVKRLWASTFDIDMAKCCFCGLCTSVCPTECLTMTKVYDFSEEKIENMNYNFSNLSPEKAIEKKAYYEQFVKEKEELKRIQAETKISNEVKLENTATTPKPQVWKPVIKPSETKKEELPIDEKETDKAIEQNISPTQIENKQESVPVKPVYKPVFKKPTPPKQE